MAKHRYTVEEMQARRSELRILINNLVKLGYGETSRREAKDLHNLRIARTELTSLIGYAGKK